MNFDDKIPGTTHFTWGEFFVTAQNQARLRSDFLALPEARRTELTNNLAALAVRLQAVRDKLGPVSISSGYRDVRVNRAVGGKPNSFHLKGMAADINIANMTPHQVQEALKDWHGGVGLNPHFTHLDTRAQSVRFKY